MPERSLHDLALLAQNASAQVEAAPIEVLDRYPRTDWTGFPLDKGWSAVSSISLRSLFSLIALFMQFAFPDGPVLSAKRQHPQVYFGVLLSVLLLELRLLSRSCDDSSGRVAAVRVLSALRHSAPDCGRAAAIRQSR